MYVLAAGVSELGGRRNIIPLRAPQLLEPALLTTTSPSAKPEPACCWKVVRVVNIHVLNKICFLKLVKTFAYVYLHRHPVRQCVSVCLFPLSLCLRLTPSAPRTSLSCDGHSCADHCVPAAGLAASRAWLRQHVTGLWCSSDPARGEAAMRENHFLYSSST